MTVTTPSGSRRRAARCSASPTCCSCATTRSATTSSCARPTASSTGSRSSACTLYVTAGADLAEQVLVNRDRTFANGPAWSHFIGPFFHRGIMLLDFDEHLHHRRILQHAFTNDALRRYHAVMAPHIRSNLAEWADAEQPVRMHHMFKALTLDLALETFVGVDLTREEQEQVNKAFIAAVRAGTSVIRKPIPGGPWARG